jgi:hypothetical protein
MPLHVEIACASPSVTIYYTVDGSTPTEESIEYTSPVFIYYTVNKACTLKAIAISQDTTPEQSSVLSVVYTFTVTPFSLDTEDEYALIGNTSNNVPYISLQPPSFRYNGPRSSTEFNRFSIGVQIGSEKMNAHFDMQQLLAESILVSLLSSEQSIFTQRAVAAFNINTMLQEGT